MLQMSYVWQLTVTTWRQESQGRENNRQENETVEASELPDSTVKENEDHILEKQEMASLYINYVINNHENNHKFIICTSFIK